MISSKDPNNPIKINMKTEKVIERAASEKSKFRKLLFSELKREKETIEKIKKEISQIIYPEGLNDDNFPYWAIFKKEKYYLYLLYNSEEVSDEKGPNNPQYIMINEKGNNFEFVNPIFEEKQDLEETFCMAILKTPSKLEKCTFNFTTIDPLQVNGLEILIELLSQAHAQADSDTVGYDDVYRILEELKSLELYENKLYSGNLNGKTYYLYANDVLKIAVNEAGDDFEYVDSSFIIN